MLIVLIAFFSSISFAESPNPPRAGRWEGRAIYSYYTTHSNFTSGGATNLLRNGSLTQMQGDFLGVYDWQPDWRFFGGVNASWVRTDDGFYSRDNSGLNEIFAGAENWYEAGPLDIAVEGDFFYPTWRVNMASDEALIGEGSLRVRGGSWVFWPLGKYRPFAYLGFEYRDEGRSYLLPYELGVKFKLPRFWIQGSFRGYESISDDGDTDNPLARNAFLQTVNAGSMRYYSVNPSASELALEGGFQVGWFGVFTGFAISVNGMNSANGWTAQAGVSISPPLLNKKKNDGFNIRKEQYDEDLFRERSKKAAPQFVEDPNFKEKAQSGEDDPYPQQEEPMPTLTPPPAAVESRPVDMQLELRRVPPKKKKKANKALDKMMNDAENSLEEAK